MTKNYPDPPLNPQQMRFVEEMVKDPSSAVAAAKRAGYSVGSAEGAAYRLMRDERVIKILEEVRQRAVVGLGLTKERVLQELWLIASANPLDAVAFDEDGEPYFDLKAINKDKILANEVVVTTGKLGGKRTKTVTVKSPKQADKIAALVKVGQELGMFKDKVEVSGKLSLLELIEKSMSEDTSPKEIKPDVTEGV